MNNLSIVTLCRLLVPILSFLLPAVGLGQSTSLNLTFSYTMLEIESGNSLQLESIGEELLAEATLKGAVPYAIWTFANKPDDAPFAGLAKNQLGLMLAWESDGSNQLNALNESLETSTSVAIISSRLFEPVYLPAGLEMPTDRGFYVHREEEYKSVDIAKAVSLSQEAWITWEPHWGVKVVGLFREVNHNTAIVNLNRIVWYPSYDAWLATRNFNEDMESALRFRERRTLLVPGSGVAIATDRLLP
jgi:hypothetical protein